MNIEVKNSEIVSEPPLPDELASDSPPLVLVTVGGSIEEFTVLYDHLEMIAADSAPKLQSLIVTRPGTPKALYKSLRARTREMPNVHIRRLGDDVEDCEEFAHETGTFYATRPKSEGGA